MTTGPRVNRLARSLTLAMLWLVAQAVPAAPAWDVAQLMQLLANAERPDVQYTEVQDLAMLTAPTRQSGILHRRADGTLEKEILEPYREKWIISATSLRIERENGDRREMSLDSDPRIGALASAFHATLGGDLGGLQEYYRLDLQGSREHWRLHLLPIANAMQAVVSHIDIEGRQGRITRFITTQADGDRTILNLHWPAAQ